MTLLGLLAGCRGPISCSFCDRWCGLSGGLLGAQCRVPRAGDSGAGAAGVCGGHDGDQGAGNAEGGGGTGKKLEKSVRDLKKQWGSKVTELEDDLELRVDEIAKSARDGSKVLHFLARAVINLERWGDEVTYDLLKIVSRTWSNAGLEGCTASPGRDINTGCSGWSRFCDHAAAVPAVLRVLPAFGSVHRQSGGYFSCMRYWYAQCKTVQQTVEI